MLQMVSFNISYNELVGIHLSENTQHLDELIEKCMKEIYESPESMTAY